MSESGDRQVSAAAATHNVNEAVRLLKNAAYLMDRVLPTGHDSVLSIENAARMAEVAGAKLGIAVKRLPK